MVLDDVKVGVTVGVTVGVAVAEAEAEMLPERLGRGGADAVFRLLAVGKLALRLAEAQAEVVVVVEAHRGDRSRAAERARGRGAARRGGSAARGRSRGGGRVRVGGGNLEAPSCPGKTPRGWLEKRKKHKQRKHTPLHTE